MSYGMDGWNHDNDLVRRKDVMDSIVREYNRSRTGDGLKLAWIEKAVNEVDAAQPTQNTRVNSNNSLDTISLEAAINALGEEPLVWHDGEGEIAEREQWRYDVAAIKALPSAQPDKSIIEDCLYHIHRNTSVHTSAEGVVAIKHYMGELWRELFGEEDMPEWMS